MQKEGVDTSLVSYVSCSIEEQRKIMSQMSQSPLYLTGSREVAAAIKELMPYTFASCLFVNVNVCQFYDFLPFHGWHIGTSVFEAFMF